MTEQLKPCPFCGAVAPSMSVGETGANFVKCNTCGASGGGYCGASGARTFWNSRFITGAPMCTVCGAPSTVTAHERHFCARCAGLLLEWMRAADMFHALDALEQEREKPE